MSKEKFCPDLTFDYFSRGAVDGEGVPDDESDPVRGERVPASTLFRHSYPGDSMRQ